MSINNISGITAIWLLPKKSDHKYLADIIADLSKTNKAFSFEPHCTIFSGIVLSRIVIESLMEENIINGSNIILNTDQIDYSNDLKKSIFINLETSDELLELHKRLSKSIDHSNVFTLDPHISLMYKTIPTEEKIRYINSIRLKETITFDKLALIEIGKNFGDWKIIVVKNI